MKTIEQASYDALNESPSYVVNAASVFHEGFARGVEFAQRWISVTDMMPENNKLVLVAIEGCMDDIVCAWHNSSGWICRLYIPTGHPDFTIEDKVTHWRPIEYK